MFNKPSISRLNAKNSGIYQIRNKENGKIYIGSSFDIENRLFNHEWNLSQGFHGNRHLQSAYNKYGFLSFECSVLEFCDNDKLQEREQFYMDRLLFAQEYIASNGKDPRFKSLGYNNAPSAYNGIGIKHSEEARRKNSENMLKNWQDEDYIEMQNKIRTPEWHKKRAHKTWNLSEEERAVRILKISEGIRRTIYSSKNVKPILLYDRFTGLFIREYRSIAECTRDNQMDKQMVLKALSKVNRYSNDIIFEYKTSDDYPKQVEPITDYYSSPEVREQMGKKIAARNSIPVLAYNKHTGEFIWEYTNAEEASHALDVSVSAIRCSTRGEELKSKPFYFRYKGREPRKYNPRNT